MIDPNSKGERSHKTSRELGPRKWNISLLLYLLFFSLILYQFWHSSQNYNDVPYSQFLALVQDGKVDNLSISETRITGELKDPLQKDKKHFITVSLNDPTLVSHLKEKGITFRAEPKTPFLFGLLSWLFPIFLIYLIWGGATRRQFGNTTRGMFGLTKSKARIYVEKDIGTTFTDVAGIDEAKEELKEIVSFLEDPKKYSRLGGRAPRGILLVGPPGTGKTLLARALAGEAKVPFLSINGSEFVEMFVGLGAARVRDLFEQARSLAPCILFVDEIDALGRRGVGFMTGSHEEKEQTMNQLLAEMDGFDTSEGVIILAATNRPEILDAALLRAGRFDRQVLVNTPDQPGRTQILKVHTKKIALDPNIRLEQIAALTPGFSGADLANLVNEATLIATRRNATMVTEKDFTAAIERIVAGLEQRSKLMNPEEKKRIAHHEMGHATVAISLGVGEKVHKISIIPRGMGALGYTLQRPTEDRYLMDREEMIRKIAVLLGGRASETLFFKEVSTGSADDLVKATNIARAMVTQFGMSEKIGMAIFEERPSPFLQSPFELQARRPLSDETARNIDHEVKAILDQSYQLAFKTLDRNRSLIEAGARRLLEVETIEEEELISLWKKYGTPEISDSTVALVRNLAAE